MKLPTFRTKPRHIVIIPHVTVKSGSHILGVMCFSTRLDGNSLRAVSLGRDTKLIALRLPCDIGGIEDSQTSIVLLVSDTEVLLKSYDLCIPDVGTVQERAEKEKRENG